MRAFGRPAYRNPLPLAPIALAFLTGAGAASGSVLAADVIHNQEDGNGVQVKQFGGSNPTRNPESGAATATGFVLLGLAVIGAVWTIDKVANGFRRCDYCGYAVVECQCNVIMFKKINGGIPAGVVPYYSKDANISYQ